jgi:ribosomal-protein-alanine N-acetyltransferase
MEQLSGVLTRDESDALVDRIEAEFDSRGFGLWAVEEQDGKTFVGFVGLLVPNFDAPFMPAVEIGWRLARDAWGHGYATEAAVAVLNFAFTRAGLREPVSMTTPANVRSQRVMQRIGMTHDPADDFDHPGFPPGHRLRHHVLYRIGVDTYPGPEFDERSPRR